MYFTLIEKISKKELTKKEIEVAKKELTEKLFSTNNNNRTNSKAQA